MSLPHPRRLALAALLGALLVPLVPGRTPVGDGSAAADWLPEEVARSSRFT